MLNHFLTANIIKKFVKKTHLSKKLNEESLIQECIEDFSFRNLLYIKEMWIFSYFNIKYTHN